MNSFTISLCIGLAAAVIDIIPMIIKRLDKLFILSAFTMWIFVGIANGMLNIVETPVLNGLAVALMFFLPLSFLIFRQDNSAFLQICITTVLLGSLVGAGTGIFIK